MSVRVRWAVRLLACLAFAVSIYLWWVAARNSSVLGCDGTSALDCDAVLTSRWSRWFGVPVAALSAGAYLVLLLATRQPRPPAAGIDRSWAARVFLVLALSIGGAAVWFIALQTFAIGDFCTYCLVCHGCGLLIAALVVFSRYAPAAKRQRANSAGTRERVSRTSHVSLGQRVWLEPVFAGFFITALISGQLLSPVNSHQIDDVQNVDFSDVDNAHDDRSVIPKAGEEEEAAETRLSSGRSGVSNGASNASPNGTGPTALDLIVTESGSSAAEPPINPKGSAVLAASGSEQIRLVGGRLTLDRGAHPLLGSPHAKRFVAELFDYTCPHCRELHKRLATVRQRYGDQLAIVLLPVALDAKCNPHVKSTHAKHAQDCRYMQLALAVWDLEPTQFPAYHHWLMESKDVPSLDDAARRAGELVGDDELQAYVKNPTIGRRLKKYGDVLAAVRGKLPVMLTPNNIIRGVPENASELFPFFEEKLGLEPIPQPPRI